MPEMRMPCAFCGAPVDPFSRFTWHRATGWERKGQAGGSDIALREKVEPAEFACDPCVSKMKLRMSPGQTSMSL